MRLTLEARDDKARAAALIESDIRSLGNKLRIAGQTYRLRVV